MAEPHLCAGRLLGQDAQEVLGEVAQERRVPVPVVRGRRGAARAWHVRPAGQAQAAPLAREKPTNTCHGSGAQGLAQQSLPSSTSSPGNQETPAHPQTCSVSISSGEQKAFLERLESLGAAFQALPCNSARWVFLLLPVSLGLPKPSPVEPQHCRDLPTKMTNVSHQMSHPACTEGRGWHRGARGSHLLSPSPTPTASAVLPGNK